MLIGIFGTGRNGSTLLGRLLDGLGETYVHPVEENFLSVFDDIAKLGRVRGETRFNSRSRALKHLSEPVSSELLRKYYAHSVNDLFGRFVSKCACTAKQQPFGVEDIIPEGRHLAADFYPAYLQALAARSRPDVSFKHHSFKTIETPFIEDYLRVFPGMKCLHILRDPVTTCSSAKRTLMERKHYPASYLGMDWLVTMIDKRWLPHARAIFRHKGDSDHLTVLYENLTKNPAHEIKRIADWLQVGMPPHPTELTVLHDCDLPEGDMNPSRAGVITPKKAVSDLQKQAGYQEILTEREIAYIRFKTAPFLAEFRYDVSGESAPSRFSLAAQYLAVDEWEFMHCHNMKWRLRGLRGAIYRRAHILV